MNRFQSIDHKLEDLANRLDARLSKDRPGYPEVLRTFEERRIDWINADVNKAIIIQPTFESKGVNSTIWNFVIVAWCDDADSALRMRWSESLIERKDFADIQNAIDTLLHEATKKLTAITKKDLK